MKLRSIHSTASLAVKLRSGSTKGSVLLALACLAFLPVAAQAQWSGSGAGGSGTDINDPANWTGGSITGSFINNTTNATLALSSASTSVSGLNFNWTTANNLTLTGNGSGASEVINLAGDILLSRAAGTSAVTIGSDVTINYGSFSVARNIAYVAAGGGGSSNLVINGKISGTATGSGKIAITYVTANPNIYLTNDGNDFDAPIDNAGNLYFTSISNVGGGPSALGAATTVANGTITNSGVLIFNGSTSQSSNRNITMSYNGGIRNLASGGSTLTLSGTVNKSNRFLDLGAASGNVLEISGQITGTTNDLRAGQAGDTGVVRLSGTNNSYTGATQIVRGTLEVASLANGGTNSSIGASSNAAANLVIRGDLSGSLKYIGSSNSSTDRLFTMQGNTGINAAGTGTVSFTNSGSIVFASAGSAANLVLTASNTGVNVMNPSLGNNGAGVVGVAKNGTGAWVLGGANTYTGTTQVNAGTLLVSGSIGNSAVAVAANAVFGGTGTVNGATVVAGSAILRGGDGAAASGALTMAGNLTLQDTSKIQLVLGASGAHSSLSRTGGAWVFDSDQAFSFLDLGATVGVYDNIISGLAGTEAGLSGIGSSTIANAGWTGTFSYDGAGGVDLMVTAVPEPSALVLSLLGVTTVLVLRRRRVVC